MFVAVAKGRAVIMAFCVCRMLRCWGQTAVWFWLAWMVTHPEVETDGAWLDWRDGCVVVKNPDEVLIAKMCEIAKKFGARVQGDEGEYHDE
ncbi:hypothetical protein BZB76_5864 [Actinomadura pelletieri DSM 43383]|uniref:Uncharacterized protein n=1 Tax=Actinomadura pelletieri DSM 43383 TaxID=1120940 RepID=A0A495QAX7_9ACTN|nr:hypothetical protein [Actinomadura pelletieri]RKS68737.1 hypothetical protein BZB76_5864 [Actinomadura pelletieri DSM 43383]